MTYVTHSALRWATTHNWARRTLLCALLRPHPTDTWGPVAMPIRGRGHPLTWRAATAPTRPLTTRIPSPAERTFAGAAAASAAGGAPAHGLERGGRNLAFPEFPPSPASWLDEVDGGGGAPAVQY
ncbi:hypothetical protein CEXT_27081 [Caerostris extrusa]|uniref:Uncharacterized protein n=1 Tax=Caerostris extrusa TaxID=172846 RepID=A0AAV4N1Q9_CAEEX|nr:hypothetical protein CEXT_27081 [Caerostris extrusa]